MSRRRCAESSRHARRHADCGRQEPTASQCGLIRRRVVRKFELHQIPTLDKFDGLRGTDACTRLALRAVGSPRREIEFDGVERADLDALVAVDAGVLDLSLGDSKQIAKREDGTARANVAAPEARLEKPQPKHRREQRERNEVAGIERRDEMPAAQDSGLQRSQREQQPARDDGDRREDARDQHATRRSHHDRQQDVVFDVNPPAIIGHAELGDSFADRPVKQIDHRSERAKIPAEPARDEDTHQQNDRGTRERPDPRSRCDRRREADERVDDEEELGGDFLLPRQIVRIVRGPFTGTLHRPRGVRPADMEEENQERDEADALDDSPQWSGQPCRPEPLQPPTDRPVLALLDERQEVVESHVEESIGHKEHEKTQKGNQE